MQRERAALERAQQKAREAADAAWAQLQRVQAAEEEAAARRTDALAAAAAAGGDAMDAEPANAEGAKRQVSPRTGSGRAAG